jgi:hypothetical protein
MKKPPAWAGRRWLDLGGGTVMPGLFNACIWDSGCRSPNAGPTRSRGYRVMLNYRRALEAILTGTTSLRIVGEPYFSDIDVRESINRDCCRAAHHLRRTRDDRHRRARAQLCGNARGRRPRRFRRAAASNFGPAPIS